jgi:type III secretory pathway lipoprotein EscJ
MNRAGPDSNAPDSFTQSSNRIIHRSDVELNQQRTKIKELVQNGHTQRKVAELLGIKVLLQGR